MTTRPELRINFDDKETVRFPAAVYAEIRRHGPVVFNELLGVWMVIGYDEVVAALHDTATFSSEAYAGASSADVINGARMMISTDPPEQIPLRKVAQQAFLRSSLRRLEATIEAVVDETLDAPQVRDAMAGGGEVEIMEAFCKQVPARVIALLLGVPVADVAKFVHWSDDLSAVMDSGGGHEDPDWPNVVARAKDSGSAMRAYLQAAIDDHRANPQEDLIGDLLVANENGILDDNELMATCILLLIAGNETTTKLIGHALRTLAAHPDQRRQLVEDPALIAGTIEETLRYEGVSAILPRIVKADTTLGGQELQAGEFVLLLNSGANRDPKAFADADIFDIHRRPENQHMAFGHGVHHCLGNRLARMEAQIAVNGFLKRYPTYEVGEFEFARAFLARGLERMWVSAGG